MKCLKLGNQGKMVRIGSETCTFIKEIYGRN